MTAKTKLVLLGDYNGTQKGYDEALKDGAVHIVHIDEQSYSAIYNVLVSIQATSDCLGNEVSIGLVQNGRYIPFDIVEAINLSPNDNPNVDYDDLDSAFIIGAQNMDIKAYNLNVLRKAAIVSLAALLKALEDGEEKEIVAECRIILLDNRTTLPKFKQQGEAHDS